MPLENDHLEAGVLDVVPGPLAEPHAVLQLAVAGRSLGRLRRRQVLVKTATVHTTFKRLTQVGSSLVKKRLDFHVSQKLAVVERLNDRQ